MSGKSHPREALGAYVLGALTPEEAAQVHGHLAGCAECRAEHDRMAGLPTLLAAVPTEAWTNRPEPSRLLLDSLLTKMRAERARSRNRSLATIWGALAAAAAVIAAVVAWGATSAGDDPTAAPAAATTAASWQLSGSNEQRGISGEVTIVPVRWGSKLDVDLEGIPVGSRCRLVVTDEAGRQWNAGSWNVNYDEELYWSGAVALRSDQIARIDVVTTQGSRLLSFA